MPLVQKRGAAVIAARKLSSAMSAAKAASDHMKDWFVSILHISKQCTVTMEWYLRYSIQNVWFENTLTYF